MNDFIFLIVKKMSRQGLFLFKKLLNLHRLE